MSPAGQAVCILLATCAIHVPRGCIYVWKGRERLCRYGNDRGAGAGRGGAGRGAAGGRDAITHTYLGRGFKCILRISLGECVDAAAPAGKKLRSEITIHEDSFESLGMLVN